VIVGRVVIVAMVIVVVVVVVVVVAVVATAMVVIARPGSARAMLDTKRRIESDRCGA
jgi:hypothetical protein